MLIDVCVTYFTYLVINTDIDSHHCSIPFLTYFCAVVTSNGSPYATGPFVLSVLSVSLSVCLSVCNVGVLWPNGWMDQVSTWRGGRPRLRRHCVRWGPSSPTVRGTTAPPTLRPMSVAAKRSPISATAELLFLLPSLFMADVFFFVLFYLWDL